MKLSIGIVNYNTGPLTKELLVSLFLHTLPEKTEIIVVDNNSTDESVPFLRSDFPEINVIANAQNVGLAAGVNTVLSKARGEYVLILNPDTIALPHSVQRLVDFMDTHPHVGIAGGKLVFPNGRLQYSCYRFYKPLTILYRRTFLGKTSRGRKETARFLMKDFDHNTEREVDWIMGACMMVRKKAVTQVGGMDERYFLYFEDVDWCRRMWNAGWQVMYAPSAVFSHFHQQSSKRGFAAPFYNRVAREHIVSALKYFWKYRGQSLPEQSKTR